MQHVQAREKEKKPTVLYYSILVSLVFVAFLFSLKV